MQRRDLFKNVTQAGALVSAAFQNDALLRAQTASQTTFGRPADSVAVDEDFWLNIRHAFTVDRNLINLNNGGVSPSPKIVMETEKRYLEISNMGPSHFMWGVLGPEIETVRRRLARSFGCDTEEMAITRNASEALEIVQLGMDLKAGDEVLTTNQDYGRMITTWEQRSRREGIVLKQIPFPVPPPSLDDLAERIERAITAKTKVIHICHVTNRTGQVFPVRKICQMARARGIETVVDGAHMHGQIPFRIDELECDFLAGSPHKWLFAPPGCGLLYIRDEMLDRLWPTITTEAWTNRGLKAARFMQVGTNSRAVLEGMGAGIRFAQAIGAERVFGRIHELARRARKLAAGIPELELLTPEDDRLYGGLVAFRMPKPLFEAFAKKAAGEKMWVYGSLLMRIATHVHTRPQDVERFFELIRASRVG